MSDDGTNERGERTPPGLVQEQAIADLDQSVADREQALADADQATIETDQAEIDEERGVASPKDLGSSVHFMHRQAALDRRQARGDVRQVQIEKAQDGGDDRQELLDAQMEATGHPSTPATATELVDELEVRKAAADQRAEGARRRAREALLRAEAAERRAEALRNRS